MLNPFPWFHIFSLKFFGKGIDNGIKYRGPRDLASLEKYIAEQLGIEYEVSIDL